MCPRRKSCGARGITNRIPNRLVPPGAVRAIGRSVRIADSIKDVQSEKQWKVQDEQLLIRQIPRNVRLGDQVRERVASPITVGCFGWYKPISLPLGRRIVVVIPHSASLTGVQLISLRSS